MGRFISIPSTFLDRSVKIQPNFMPEKLEVKRGSGENHPQLSERSSRSWKSRWEPPLAPWPGNAVQCGYGVTTHGKTPSNTVSTAILADWCSAFPQETVKRQAEWNCGGSRSSRKNCRASWETVSTRTTLEEHWEGTPLL